MISSIPTTDTGPKQEPQTERGGGAFFGRLYFTDISGDISRQILKYANVYRYELQMYLKQGIELVVGKLSENV